MLLGVEVVGAVGVELGFCLPGRPARPALPSGFLRTPLRTTRSEDYSLDRSRSHVTIADRVLCSQHGTARCFCRISFSKPVNQTLYCIQTVLPTDGPRVVCQNLRTAFHHNVIRTKVATSYRPSGVVIYEWDRSRKGNRSDMIVLVCLRRCCSVDLTSRARRRSFAGDLYIVCPATLQHECVILLELPSQAAATRTGPWRRACSATWAPSH